MRYPNTADYTHAFLNSQQWSSTSTFTGTAGLSLANGSMAVCVAIHCASAVSVEASPPSLSRCAVISAGVSPEELGVYPYSFEVRSMTADRKDALLGAPASSFCLALCTQLVCGCRGLLGVTTGLTGTGGRMKGLGLGLGLILASVSDPAPE